jgi:hypothetical protein
MTMRAPWCSAASTNSDRRAFASTSDVFRIGPL